jgi:hypothetical protein
VCEGTKLARLGGSTGKVQLVVNLKAAKQIGVTILPNVLYRANKLNSREAASDTREKPDEKNFSLTFLQCFRLLFCCSLRAPSNLYDQTFSLFGTTSLAAGDAADKCLSASPNYSARQLFSDIMRSIHFTLCEDQLPKTRFL